MSNNELTEKCENMDREEVNYNIKTMRYLGNKTKHLKNVLCINWV